MSPFGTCSLCCSYKWMDKTFVFLNEHQSVLLTNHTFLDLNKKPFVWHFLWLLLWWASSVKCGMNFILQCAQLRLHHYLLCQFQFRYRSKSSLPSLKGLTRNGMNFIYFFFPDHLGTIHGLYLKLMNSLWKIHQCRYEKSFSYLELGYTGI